ncbi:Leucine-rich repeat protein [Seminavis robusta]|uniref:Leucine-rich repeat protein n=1 Tax=Seminavis robusta TaxID=568900 RepID=A0A9N8HHG1_9STRA|nr:Leucine-rich repeat protein [Seminavis robusta]|eukprot:Sro446_g144750.1 Leucine-rich repeat protein (811) ;mRNA; r:53290-56005
MTSDSRHAEAAEIACMADFTGLTAGYDHTSTLYFDDSYSGEWCESSRSHRTKWFAMDEPVFCRYTSDTECEKHLGGIRGITRNSAGTKIDREDGANSISIPDGAERGITLRQLRAVKANADRRCLEEEWKDRNGNPLIPDTVTMYDICRYVILPFTVHTRRSFVESLPSTAGTQPPLYFVSHWWGEPTKDFMACVERLLQDKWMSREIGMTEDTPIWICAYANNQWHLEEAITEDPDESAFSRALALANGRTLTIFDKDGVVFSRVWCIYEIYRTIVFASDCDNTNVQPDANQDWVVLTSVPHTEIVKYTPTKRTSRGAANIGEYFPFDMVMKALQVRVELAEASEESDRIHIFNAIIGKKDNLDAQPPGAHEMYDKLNNEVRATFASQGVLQSAAERSDEEWNTVIAALSKGSRQTRMRFDFDTNRWKGLVDKPERAGMLMRSLPLSLASLSLSNSSLGLSLIEGLADWIRRSTRLQEIHLNDISSSGGLPGELLAKALASCTTITEIHVENTDLLQSENLHHWAHLLAATKSLKSFCIWERDCGKDEVGWGDEVGKVLARGIAANTSLNKIKLSWWKRVLGTEARKELFCALLKNPCFSSVNAKQCEWELQEENLNIGRDRFSQFSKVLVPVFRFTLPMVQALSQRIKNSKTLKRISITDIQVDCEVAGGAGECLAQALGSSTTLFKVMLSTNMITLENARNWTDFLATASSLKVFECWNCDGPPLGDGGMKILCEGISKNTSLKKIELHDHGVGKEGVVALGAALMQNLSVEEVTIYEKTIDEGVADNLRTALLEAVKERGTELRRF